ncbi:MAG: hypothetical protein JXR42_01545 [Gammaproteobacteria bacterium]|nr:hypothetical protein [Gammaproteobacteria bacterium]
MQDADALSELELTAQEKHEKYEKEFRLYRKVRGALAWSAAPFLLFGIAILLLTLLAPHLALAALILHKIHAFFVIKHASSMAGWKKLFDSVWGLIVQAATIFSGIYTFLQKTFYRKWLSDILIWKALKMFFFSKAKSKDKLHGLELAANDEGHRQEMTKKDEDHAQEIERLQLLSGKGTDHLRSELMVMDDLLPLPRKFYSRQIPYIVDQLIAQERLVGLYLSHFKSNSSITKDEIKGIFGKRAKESIERSIAVVKRHYEFSESAEITNKVFLGGYFGERYTSFGDGLESAWRAGSINYIDKKQLSARAVNLMREYDKGGADMDVAPSDVSLSDAILELGRLLVDNHRAAVAICLNLTKKKSKKKREKSGASEFTGMDVAKSAQVGLKEVTLPEAMAGAVLSVIEHAIKHNVEYTERRRERFSRSRDVGGSRWNFSGFPLSDEATGTSEPFPITAGAGPFPYRFFAGSGSKPEPTGSQGLGEESSSDSYYSGSYSSSSE